MTKHMQREAEEEKKLRYAAGTKVSCNDKTSARRRREKNFQYASGTTTTAAGGGGAARAAAAGACGDDGTGLYN